MVDESSQPASPKPEIQSSNSCWDGYQKAAETMGLQKLTENTILLMMICRHFAFVLDCTISSKWQSSRSQAFQTPQPSKNYAWKKNFFEEQYYIESIQDFLLGFWPYSLLFGCCLLAFALLLGASFMGWEGQKSLLEPSTTSSRSFFPFSAVPKTCLGRKSSTKEYKSDFTLLSHKGLWKTH